MLRGRSNKRIVYDERPSTVRKRLRGFERKKYSFSNTSKIQKMNSYVIKTTVNREMEFRYRRNVDVRILQDFQFIRVNRVFYWQNGFSFTDNIFRKKIEKVEKTSVCIKENFLNYAVSTEINWPTDSYTILTMTHPIYFETRYVIYENGPVRLQIIHKNESCYIDYEFETRNIKDIKKCKIFDKAILLAKDYSYFKISCNTRENLQVFRENVAVGVYENKCLCAKKLDGIYGNAWIRSDSIQIITEDGYIFNKKFVVKNTQHLDLQLAVEKIGYNFYILDIIRYGNYRVKKENYVYLNLEKVLSFLKKFPFFSFQKFYLRKVSSEEGTIFLKDKKWYKEKHSTTVELLAVDSTTLQSCNGKIFKYEGILDKNCIYECNVNKNLIVIRKRLDRFIPQCV